MNEKSKVRELQDALENLAKNPDGLTRDELQKRIRAVCKEAIYHANMAESAGKIEEAAALYRLAAWAYRHLAELASGELRTSELATAEFWEEHAALVNSKRDRALAREETPQPAKSRAIHTPKPIPLPPQTSIRREQAGGLSGPADRGSRRAERFERPQRKQVGEHDDQVHDSGTFRKPEQK